MSTTLDDIAAWVQTTYLKRTDINALAVGAAKDFYMVLCAKVPFDALEVTGAELPVSTTTTTHSLASLNPALSGIISIRMTYGTGQVARLRRSNVRSYDTRNPTSTGRPYSYARWAGGIEFNCLANLSTYTYRLRYWTIPTIDATSVTTIGATVLVTPPEWDELIKWETLYRVYTALDEHERAMSLVQPAMLPRQSSPKRTIVAEVGIIPKLWNDLLITRNQRESPDEEYGVNPRIRAYTAGGR